MNCATIATGAIALGLLGQAANAGIICIDDFTTGAFSDSQSAVNVYYNQQAGSMLGGQRDLRYEIVSNTFGLSSDVVIGAGMVFNANDPGITGSIALDYDGAGEAEVDGNADFVAGPGLNANWTGAPSIDIDFLFLDLDFDVRVVLQTYGGPLTAGVIGESVIQQTVSASGGAFTENFLLASATPTMGGGVDLSDVDRLTIYFNDNQVAAVDFGIAKIAVPTPSSAALLAVGGLIGCRRRR